MTEIMPTASLLIDAPDRCDDTVVLDYDARLIRRKRLVTAAGVPFLVDLPNVTNLDAYWGFALADGRGIRIIPAEESVLLITGDLARLAWHIGNRHTPCQIEGDRLIIREDHVLEGMLKGLGAGITRAALPFIPEGGAYGHGRTMGHSQGPEDHGHSHDATHSHSHAHSHTHSHSHDHGHHHHTAVHSHDQT